MPVSAKLLFCIATVLVSASYATAQEVSSIVRRDLIPTGKLRAGLNLGNPNTVVRDPVSGDLHGVAVDLSRALAARLGTEVEPVPYPTVAKLAETAGMGAWDIAFLAIDPARSGEIAFTAPYMEVDNTYLLPPGSPVRTIADIDRPGFRIAVQRTNAPDLYLTRTLQHAVLLRAANDADAFEILQTGRADAMASARGDLIRYAGAWPGSRVLNERILAVEHALAIPKAREAALGYLQAFIEQAKRSGLVSRGIEQSGLQGVRVASPTAE